MRVSLQLLIHEHTLQRLEEELGRGVHHGVVLVVEVAMLLRGRVVALRHVLENWHMLAMCVRRFSDTNAASCR